MEKLLVVKAGTNVLVDDLGQMDLNTMRNLARDINAVREETGNSVVLVTSGAVGFGNERKGLKEKLKGKRDSVTVKRALAAYGQPKLIRMWGDAFDQTRPQREVAQFLITHGNLANKAEREDMLATMRVVLEEGDIPIFNENDTLADKEIRFGDNDQLASKLAVSAGAEGLVILSDVKGLLDKDPAYHSDAKLVEKIKASQITKHFTGPASLNGQRPFRLEIALDGGLTVVLTSESGGNSNGTGGIASKIDAGREFVEKTGHSANIAQGKERGVLGRIVRGEGSGTVILPE